MFQNNIKRTPEQGHSVRCLAQAMISAIENARDARSELFGGDEYTQEVEFRLWAQDNIALQWADEYLKDGTADCLCDPIDTPDGRAALEHFVNWTRH